MPFPGLRLRDNASGVRGDSMRAFFKRHSGIVRTAEFALAAGAALVALGAGGDMFTVNLALIVGLVFAFLGFAASNLKSWLRVFLATGAVGLIFLSERCLLDRHFHPPSEPGAAQPHDEEASPQVKDAARPLAPKQVSLLWECQTATLPNVVPSGGVNIIETSIDDDGTHPNVDFVLSDEPPGSPYRKDHVLAQKCSLINFGDETIFDIPILFKASFTIASDERTGVKTVVAKGQSPNVPVRSLDRGRDNPYIIYIQNLSRKFAVDIEMPTTSSYVTADDSTRKEAKFLPLGMRELFMTLFPATH
jgi:hypothetical protein